jgi:hypothetical protein
VPTIRGISNWAFVHKPDKFKNYTISVDVDDSFIEVLKTGKVKAKLEEIDPDKASEVHDPSKSFKFNFRRSLERKDGSENPPPQVVDSKKQPIPPTTLIGNGSEVVVQYSTYEYPDSGEVRTAIVLDAV